MAAPPKTGGPGAPQEATLGTLFRDGCARFAERVAVSGAPAQERGVTYAELYRRVLARAADWQGRGARPGDRVAYLGENTPRFLEAYFAAAWLGCVLVPLNHRLSPRELAEILADAAPRLGFAEPVFGELAGQALPGGFLTSEPAEGAPDEATPAPPLHPSGPDELAHLYYTSGTTGRPKGVMLTHRNVLTHARTSVAELGLDAEDRWGHFAPMFHLADAWASFAITEVGGVHVLPGRFDARRALEVIEAERVTRSNLVPTMLAAMLADPEVHTRDLSSLRMILSGGAPIAPALVRRILETFGCTYVQTYGMTETSPFLTLGLLTPELEALPEDERLALVARTGRPFTGIDLEVVSADGEPVPADDRSVGEIRARGATVSPGYWNRPKETAEAFRDGWLYTGDLAVIDARGFLNIVDRKKDVILTGGENVYSTEVESVLYEHPDVVEAAVVGRPDERWGERVHAACVLRSGSEATEKELVSFCRERIASFKVPRSIELLAELPKTGSGKIAKHLLRGPLRGKSGGGGEAGAPGS